MVPWRIDHITFYSVLNKVNVEYNIVYPILGFFSISIMS